MSDVLCKHCTINLRSELRSKSGKWEPFAMVWCHDGDIIVGHAFAGELQDTEVLANTVALKLAKAWVVAKCTNASFNAGNTAIEGRLHLARLFRVK